MKQLLWLLAVAAVAGFAYWLRRWRGRRAAHKRASEERAARFMAQAMAAPNVIALARQKLLLEAAARAAEAGEPVLAIQLYARLLARYPNTGFAPQARAAVEAQKKNLGKT